MSVVQAICTSFKVELLQGIHDFSPLTGDTFKLALYTGAANLSALTTAYSAADEIADSGAYTAGGVTLTQTALGSDGATGLVSFENISIAATITASGAMIYNSSTGDRAVAVLDFGAPRASFGGVFAITFPAANAAAAIIRIG